MLWKMGCPDLGLPVSTLKCCLRWVSTECGEEWPERRGILRPPQLDGWGNKGVQASCPKTEYLRQIRFRTLQFGKGECGEAIQDGGAATACMSGPWTLWNGSIGSPRLCSEFCYVLSLIAFSSPDRKEGLRAFSFFLTFFFAVPSPYFSSSFFSSWTGQKPSGLSSPSHARGSKPRGAIP